MRVARALGRQHLAMVTDATLDDLERDEPLNIGAELGEVFSRRRARSFSNARSTTRCGKDGLSVLDAPCSTRLSGSPAAP
jgi:hypothetical protein